MPIDFTTPVGRIVWGHPTRPQKKTDDNNRPVLGNDGQPVEQWVCGVAFQKAEFEQYVLPYLQQEAYGAYPNGTPERFSWKYKDGDTAQSKNGTPYRDMDGRAGTYILTISTEAYCPPVYKNEGGRYRQLEVNEIKCGDFVVVSLNIKYNNATGNNTKGIYVNPKGFELVGYGQEITGSIDDPDEMFGGRTYQLPPGATAQPQASTGNTAAPYQGAPQQYAAPGQQPMAAPQAQPTAQQGLPAPAHDFVNNTVQGGQPQVAPQEAPAPGQPPAMAGLPAGR